MKKTSNLPPSTEPNKNENLDDLSLSTEENEVDEFLDPLEEYKLQLKALEINADKAPPRKTKIQAYAKRARKEKIRAFKAKIAATDDILKRQKLKNEYRRLFKECISQNSRKRIIELNNVNKFYYNGYTSQHILKNITFSINKAEIVIILGTSGSGKSTLLNVISGLTSCDYGSLVVANHDLMLMNEKQKIKFRARNLAFIFQSYNLISTLNAIENIKVGYTLKNAMDKQIDIPFILKILDLTDYKKFYPYQLSGGQQQRVSIGRALAKNPKILFADEPTGALDEQKGDEVLQLLIDINKKFQTTIIIVTHNISYAKIADKVIKIKNGEIEEIIINKKPEREITKLAWNL